MTSKEFTVKTEEDAYNLSASARLIGDDVLVAIWGGEKPHIGAVAVAQPRPSLRDPQVTSSSASVIQSSIFSIQSEQTGSPPSHM